jgi:hypothetical protein
MVPKRGVVGLLEKRLIATSGLGLTDAVDLIGDYNHDVQDPMTIGSDLGYHNNHGEDPANHSLAVADVVGFNMDRSRSLESPITFTITVHVALDGYRPPGGGGGDPDLSQYEMTANETVVVGQPIYISGDNTINLADADTDATSQVFGLVSVGASANGTANVLSEGSVNQADWTSVIGATSLTPGSLYYLSSTAGELTTTKPTGNGVQVGRAVTTTKFDIETNDFHDIATPVDPSSYTVTANETVAVGQPIYISASDTVNLADASLSSTANVLGLVSVGASASNTATVLSEGSVNQADWTSVTGTTNLTPGSVYYLSGTTGKMTTTKPTSGGDIIIQLGTAVSTTKFNIEVQEVVENLSKHNMTASASNILVRGTPVYVSSSNVAELADASAVATAQVLGLVLVGAFIGQPVVVLSEGSIEQSDWSAVTSGGTLTAGSVYYLSATEGEMTTTPPSGNGDTVVRLGIAVTTTKFDIEVNEVVSL